MMNEHYTRNVLFFHSLLLYPTLNGGYALWISGMVATLPTFCTPRIHLLVSLVYMEHFSFPNGWNKKNRVHICEENKTKDSSRNVSTTCMNSVGETPAHLC